mmetsp:Transcript_27410/g.93305  ORF Transcript_27410/g.93305 Transcript_27410/m.93305 type:complete len:323 (+) Transcript_27410:937-1905(+)
MVPRHGVLRLVEDAVVADGAPELDGAHDQDRDARRVRLARLEPVDARVDVDRVRAEDGEQHHVDLVGQPEVHEPPPRGVDAAAERRERRVEKRARGAQVRAAHEQLPQHPRRRDRRAAAVGAQQRQRHERRQDVLVLPLEVQHVVREAQKHREDDAEHRGGVLRRLLLLEALRDDEGEDEADAAHEAQRLGHGLVRGTDGLARGPLQEVAAVLGRGHLGADDRQQVARRAVGRGGDGAGPQHDAPQLAGDAYGQSRRGAGEGQRRHEERHGRPLARGEDRRRGDVAAPLFSALVGVGRHRRRRVACSVARRRGWLPSSLWRG